LKRSQQIGRWPSQAILDFEEWRCVIERRFEYVITYLRHPITNATNGRKRRKGSRDAA
jgi:hypothetical protein